MFDSYFEMQGVAFAIFGQFYSFSFNIVTSPLNISSSVWCSVLVPSVFVTTSSTSSCLEFGHTNFYSTLLRPHRCFENRIRRGQIISAACQRKLKACHRFTGLTRSRSAMGTYKTKHAGSEILHTHTAPHARIRGSSYSAAVHITVALPLGSVPCICRHASQALTKNHPQ